jgi:hypothetical protein
MPLRLTSPKVLVLSLALALAVRAPVAAAGAAFPPVARADASKLGVGIQRTMAKLAASTPEHRNTVRVLFYGQSITEQTWSNAVADDLRKRFPHANLVIENRAIGGFASQLLVRPAEHDLYPFYPDLLIFHVYGANNTYEEIIKNVRSRTTAEVLMQTDHVSAAGWTDNMPDRNGPQKDLWWDWLMNHGLLPEIAKKYGCALVDVRGSWVNYLKSNHLKPQQLLKDGVHLNDHGNFVMAEIVKQYLVHRPELADAPETKAAAEMIQTIDVGKAARWKDGKLELTFEGNRVDVIAAPDGAGKAEVRVDGKRPSEIDGCHAITRPAPGPWSPLFLTRVDRGDAPLTDEEEWTLTVKSFDLNGAPAGLAFEPDAAAWTFDLTGSRTGPDGSGRDDQPFVSNSKKVRIAPTSWMRNGQVKPPYPIKWRTTLTGTDTVEAKPAKDATIENEIVLAQGLSNGKHTLTLTGEAPIKAIRVYRPPVKAD